MRLRSLWVVKVMSKYKVIHAFAYTNESIMRKLEKYSAEGWHFKKFLGFFVLLEKGEKVNYKYELVYDKKVRCRT